MDPNLFTQLLIESVVHGIKLDIAVAWNALQEHPSLVVVIAAVGTGRLISRLTAVRRGGYRTGR